MRRGPCCYQSAPAWRRLAPPTPRGKKIAVIGQMIFLGKEAEIWHATLAE
jgi:UDP-N-acetylmuramyl pentapeptide synthase